MIASSPKTILLVEDEALIALAESRKIEGFGYRTLVAGSGERAVELMAEDNAIRLILMDIDLGKGMSGPEAAERILERRHLPIVFLTSHAEREMVEKVRGITRYGYVIKNSGDFVLQTSIEMAFELFESNESIRIQHDLSLSLNSSADLREGLDRVLETVMGYESIDSGGVYTVDPGTGSLELMAHRGLSPEFILRASHYEPDSPNVRMAYAGEARYGDYSDIRPSTDDIRQGEGLRALAFIPVLSHGRLIAVLNLASHSHDSIPDSTRISLETLAQQIGSALMRLRADSVLRESEEKYRLLVENSHDIIYTLDGRGNFLFVSPAWTELLGHPVDEVVGKPFQMFAHPDDIPACEAFLRRAIETGQRANGIEYRVRHADGAWLWHSSSASPLVAEGGEVAGIYGIARDITKRKQAEERIKEMLAEKEVLLAELRDRFKHDRRPSPEALEPGEGSRGRVGQGA
jgi:PAS domain S-box-containing protein